MLGDTEKVDRGYILELESMWKFWAWWSQCLMKLLELCQRMWNWCWLSHFQIYLILLFRSLSSGRKKSRGIWEELLLRLLNCGMALNICLFEVVYGVWITLFMEYGLFWTTESWTKMVQKKSDQLSSTPSENIQAGEALNDTRTLWRMKVRLH